MQNEAKGKSPDELNDKPFLDDKNFHLAGIIPVAGHKVDFGMEWDESLAPISPNYTLIENAVYECAWAGCDTIWIVVNDDMAPLLRYRLGKSSGSNLCQQRLCEDAEELSKTYSNLLYTGPPKR